MAEDKEKMNNSGKGKLGVDLNQLVFNMIGELPERSRDIIIKRFNLDGKGVKTLGKIGKEYHITRERVRQIEAEAISKLKKIGEKHHLNEVSAYLRKVIKEYGGLMSEDKIIKIFFPDKNTGLPADGQAGEIKKRLSLLFLSLDDRIKEAKETKAHKKLYFYEKESLDKFEKTIGKIETFLREKKQSVNFDKIAELTNEVMKESGSGNFSSGEVRSYIEASKIILENILGVWGHKEWPDINPRSARDKSYLVLKKSMEPLHFVEIANRINGIWGQKKKVNKQTAHNELIKDPRFVLVGRGIYALKEWGYRPGTVLDCLIETLKEAGKETAQEEIVQRVLKKRKVKKNTIVLNLQNKEHFEKLEGKIYRLK